MGTLDLTNPEEITKFLEWVEEEEGRQTAAAANILIKVLQKYQATIPPERLDLVDLARSAAHSDKMKAASELSNQPTDSNFWADRNRNNLDNQDRKIGGR